MGLVCVDKQDSVSVTLEGADRDILLPLDRASLVRKSVVS